MEMDIFEMLQTQGVRHFSVEAAGAKLPVTLFDRAVVHDIQGRDCRTTCFAADFAVALLAFVTHVISTYLSSVRGRFGQALSFGVPRLCGLESRARKKAPPEGGTPN